MVSSPQRSLYKKFQVSEGRTRRSTWWERGSRVRSGFGVQMSYPRNPSLFKLSAVLLAGFCFRNAALILTWRVKGENKNNLIACRLNSKRRLRFLRERAGMPLPLAVYQSLLKQEEEILKIVSLYNTKFNTHFVQRFYCHKPQKTHLVQYTLHGPNLQIHTFINT